MQASWPRGAPRPATLVAGFFVLFAAAIVVLLASDQAHAQTPDLRTLAADAVESVQAPAPVAEQPAAAVTQAAAETAPVVTSPALAVPAPAVPVPAVSVPEVPAPAVPAPAVPAPAVPAPAVPAPVVHAVVIVDAVTTTVTQSAGPAATGAIEVTSATLTTATESASAVIAPVRPAVVAPMTSTAPASSAATAATSPVQPLIATTAPPESWATEPAATAVTGSDRVAADDSGFASATAAERVGSLVPVSHVTRSAYPASVMAFAHGAATRASGWNGTFSGGPGAVAARGWPPALSGFSAAASNTDGGQTPRRSWPIPSPTTALVNFFETARAGSGGAAGWPLIAVLVSLFAFFPDPRRVRRQSGAGGLSSGFLALVERPG